MKKNHPHLTPLLDIQGESGIIFASKLSAGVTHGPAPGRRRFFPFFFHAFFTAFRRGVSAPPLRAFLRRSSLSLLVAAILATGTLALPLTAQAQTTYNNLYVSGGGGGGADGGSGFGGAGGAHAGAGGDNRGGGGGAYVGDGGGVNGGGGEDDGGAGGLGKDNDISGATAGDGGTGTGIGIGAKGGAGGSASLGVTGNLNATTLSITAGNGGGGGTGGAGGAGGSASLDVTGNLNVNDSLTITAGNGGGAPDGAGGAGGNATTIVTGNLNATTLSITAGYGGQGGRGGGVATGGAGGNATLGVTGNLDATTLSITAGDGGQGIDGGGTGGAGGNATTTVTGNLTAATLNINAGDGGEGVFGGNGAGGSATTTVGGNLNTTTLTINAGDGGRGLGVPGSAGGNATLSVTGNLTVDNNLSITSGDKGAGGGWGGAGGTASLSAGTLIAPAITLTKQHGELTVNVGTLDMRANDTTLNLDATTAGNGTSGVRIGSFIFGGNRTLTLNSANNGTLALGHIMVSGKGNRMAGNLATPLSITSLTFSMDDAQAGDTLLDAGGKLRTSAATTTALTAGRPLSQFSTGDRVTLVSNLNVGSTYTAQSGVAATTYGATDYVFDVGLDGASDLVATYAGRQVNQNAARGYAYGMAARSVALNNAYDSMLNVIGNWQMAGPDGLPASGARFSSFAQLSAAHTKTKTGSHVDNDGITFVGGGGWELPTQNGSLLLGLFAEGGTGSYDSYNSFARGDGDTWHYGAGGFAKFGLNSGTYFEGSVRTGRTKADFEAKRLDDAAYDSTSWYWGAHAGIGQVWQFNPVSAVDAYAKVIWTRTDSDSVTTKANERLHFDAVDSTRSRLGARYVHTTDSGLKAYAGAGWEYEFDGRVKSSLEGQKIHGTNELEGHSGLLEAGLTWNAGKAWTLNARVEGLVGRREGVNGTFMASYRF